MMPTPMLSFPTGSPEMADLMDELSALLDSEESSPVAIKPAKYGTPDGMLAALDGTMITAGTISARHMDGVTTTSVTGWEASDAEIRDRAKDARKRGADDLLAAMSPAVRQIVRQDAGFRLASVLQGVQQQKRAKLSGYARLQSVLSQVSAQKQAAIDPYDGDFGSW